MSSKKITITPAIETQIRNAVDDQNLNVANFAVFEARTITTEPLKSSGLFRGSRFTPATLQEMANTINSPGGAVPLMVMHNTDVLPIGKVFQGEVSSLENGETELRSLFYIPGDKAQLVSDIENSVIDEVSVGVATNHIYCSECDFDYMSDEATFSNIYTATCNEGHTIGEDGVFGRLVGLKSWGELSLVGKGAAKNPKILSRQKQALAKDVAENLAASHKPLEAVLSVSTHKIIEASASDNNNNGDLKMETKELLAELKAATSEAATVKAELKSKDGEITTLKGQVTSLEASVKEKDDKIKALEAAQGADTTALKAELKTVTEKDTALAAKLRVHAEAALVASGATAADLPKDATTEAMLSLIEDKGLKLHQVVGSTTNAATKSDVTDTKLSSRSTEAYKTPKRNYK